MYLYKQLFFFPHLTEVITFIGKMHFWFRGLGLLSIWSLKLKKKKKKHNNLQICKMIQNGLSLTLN